MDLRTSTVKRYAVVLAHTSGAAVERVLMATVTTDMDQAQAAADAWTRQHGHRAHGTDRNGHYAYADRVTQARAPEAGSKIRMPVS